MSRTWMKTWRNEYFSWKLNWMSFKKGQSPRVGPAETVSWVPPALLRNANVGTGFTNRETYLEDGRWDHVPPSGISLSNHRHSSSETPITPTLASIWRKPIHLDWQKHAVIFISMTKHANVAEIFWLIGCLACNPSGNWSAHQGTNSSTTQVESRKSFLSFSTYKT